MLNYIHQTVKVSRKSLNSLFQLLQSGVLTVFLVVKSNGKSQFGRRNGRSEENICIKMDLQAIGWDLALDPGQDRDK
jgi:hypothetical protein